MSETTARQQTVLAMWNVNGLLGQEQEDSSVVSSASSVSSRCAANPMETPGQTPAGRTPRRPTGGRDEDPVVFSSPARRLLGGAFKTAYFVKGVEADTQFKARMLRRRSSVRIHQGHNIVSGTAEAKAARRYATDTHVPVADKIALSEFTDAPQSFLPWYTKLKNSHGTTDSEIQITQAKVLNYESELIAGWSEEARKFVELEKDWDLLKSEKEILLFRARSDKLEKEGGLKFLPIIALASITNRQERKRRKGAWKSKVIPKESVLLSRILEERRGLQEELLQRRFKSKNDIKNCFKNSSEILKQLGDKINRTCANIKSSHTEITLKSMYEKKMRVGRFNMYDSYHFMHKKVYLSHYDEESDGLHIKDGNLTVEIKPTQNSKRVWHTIYANIGPVPTKRVQASIKQAYLSRIEQKITQKDVFDNPIKAHEAFNLLAQALDGLHTVGPRVHGKVMRRQDRVREILTNRLMMYGYIHSVSDNSLTLTDKFSDKRAVIAVRACFKSFKKRASKFLSFYFEIYRPAESKNTLDFMIGWGVKTDGKDGKLGRSNHSFGLCSNGTCWHNNEQKEYCADLKRATIIGVVLDKLNGCITFYADGHNLGVAFGVHSEIYPSMDQMMQGEMIRKSDYIPAVALNGKSGELSCNFGGFPFVYKPEGAGSCESFISFEPEEHELAKSKRLQETTKAWFTPSPVTRGLDSKESKRTKDRNTVYSMEETLRMLSEKAEFTDSTTCNSVIGTIEEDTKASTSWSNFPPTRIKYERSIRILQRFIRKYVSRHKRRREAKEVKDAVLLLGRFIDARKKGYKFSKKHSAVLKVQRVWRGNQGRKRFKLLSQYSHSAEKMTSSAIIIQSAYRSRLAKRRARYKKRSGFLTVTSLKLRMKFFAIRMQRRVRQKRLYKYLEGTDVVLKIQKAWRGWNTRNHMDPLTYAKLQALKENFRRKALRNRKAIVIQKVWRRYSALQAFKKMGTTKPLLAKPKKKRGGKKKVTTKAVLPLAKVLDTIAGIYEKKVKADIIDEKKGNEKDTLPEFVADFFEHMYGIPALSNKKKAEFQNGVRKYQAQDLRTRWFGTMVGWLPDTVHQGLHTPYQDGAIDSYLAVLQRVLPVDSIEERMDDDPCVVSLTATINAVTSMFGEKTTKKPQVAKCFGEIKSLGRKEAKNPKIVVELDMAFEVIMRTWYEINVPQPQDDEGVVAAAAT